MEITNLAHVVGDCYRHFSAWYNAHVISKTRMGKHHGLDSVSYPRLKLHRRLLYSCHLSKGRICVVVVVVNCSHHGLQGCTKMVRRPGLRHGDLVKLLLETGLLIHVYSIT